MPGGALPPRKVEECYARGALPPEKSRGTPASGLDEQRRWFDLCASDRTRSASPGLLLTADGSSIGRRQRASGSAVTSAQAGLRHNVAGAKAGMERKAIGGAP